MCGLKLSAWFQKSLITSLSLDCDERSRSIFEAFSSQLRRLNWSDAHFFHQDQYKLLTLKNIQRYVANYNIVVTRPQT